MVQGSFRQSVGFAVDGLLDTVVEQRNMRLHLLAALLVTQVGVCLSWAATEQALFLGCVASVFFAELMNSAIERTVDLASLERTENGRRAKDSAAAAVLVLAVGSAGVLFSLVVARSAMVFADPGVIGRQVLVGVPMTLGCAGMLAQHRLARTLGSAVALGTWAASWWWAASPTFQVVALLLLALGFATGRRARQQKSPG
jgi:diacylglycerol kinase (ATP)